MNPATTNLYKTLGLFIMLKDQAKVSAKELTEEDRATLRISRQLLTDADLTIPELVASTKWLSEKGYVKGLTIFDENLRQKADEELQNISEEEMTSILATLDTPEKEVLLKKAMTAEYSSILPPGTEFDMESVTATAKTWQQLAKQPDKRLRFQNSIFEGSLEYTKNDGFGTAKLSPIYSVYQQYVADSSSLVPPPGIEPGSKG